MDEMDIQVGRRNEFTRAGYVEPTEDGYVKLWSDRSDGHALLDRDTVERVVEEDGDALVVGATGELYIVEDDWVGRLDGGPVDLDTDDWYGSDHTEHIVGYSGGDIRDVLQAALDALDDAEDDFAEYLEDHVFTSGNYVFDEDGTRGGVVVREFEKEVGFILSSDIERAVEDERVNRIGFNKNGAFITENK